jgi:hypothetical protein
MFTIFDIFLVWKTILKDKKANQVLHCLYYPENLKDFEVLKILTTFDIFFSFGKLHIFSLG